MSTFLTPTSLLQRLRQAPEAKTWERFVDLYTPLLFAWTARLRLSDHDAADLVQDVFASVVESMPRFQYDTNGSFRAWLKTVLLNRWRTRIRRADNNQRVGDPALDEVIASDDQLGDLDESEYRRYVVQRAMTIMQTDFQAETWQACWQFVVESRPAQEVAQNLGITVNAVYLAKTRVLRRLREELRGLMD